MLGDQDMLRKVIIACLAVTTIALAIPTEASARYYGYYRGWGPRYYGGYYPRYRYYGGYYPRYRYYGYPRYRYGVYPYGYGCWRSVWGPFGWHRVWVCG
jgi:hypothetical protein